MKINWGVYESVDKSRFVHFTTYELPKELGTGTLVKVCITQREAWETAGLEWSERERVGSI
jgi:hypothetical protein